MSGDTTTPSIPPSAATAEQILGSMLPLVIRAATDAAASSSEVAAVLQTVEGRLATFEAALNQNTAEVKRLAELKKAEAERGGWWRSIITPQVVITALMIMAGYLGIYFNPPALQQAQPTTQEAP